MNRVGDLFIHSGVAKFYTTLTGSRIADAKFYIGRVSSVFINVVMAAITYAAIRARNVIGVA